jgi:hypothetical protein
MDITTIAFYGTGVFVVLIILRYLLVAQNLLGFVLEKPSNRYCERSDCPGDIQEFYEIKEKELLDLGFRFAYAHTTTDMVVKKHSLRYYFIYYHPEQKTYASLSTSPEAESVFPFRVAFSTYFNNHPLPESKENVEKLITVNGIRHTIMGEIPGALLQDAYAETLEKQWAFHLETLAKMSRRELGTFEETREGFAEMLALEDRSIHEYIEQLEKKGLIFKRSENRYLIKTLPSLGFAHQLFRGESKLNAMKRRIMEAGKGKPQPVPPPLHLEVENYENAQSLLNQKNRNTSGKIAFLAFTVLLFILVFGFLFSFEMAFLLTAVIFIHECGHLLAMSLFGYRDLRMLFVPLFGAVALGSDRGIPPYKKVITYFAGPVPGILLAFLILLILRYANIALVLNPTLMMVILMLLFINYFNLIPVMPLDGGQILNTIIFSRFPLLQFLFLVFSILTLAILALFLEAPLLLIFAFLIPFGYRNHWAQKKLVTRLRERMKNRGTLSDDDILGETFLILREAPYSRYPFQRKIQVVKYVADNVSAARPSGKAIVLTLFFYGVVFVLPVVYFLVHFLVPMWSMKHPIFSSYRDPCALVQQVEMPVNTAVAASRFQRVPSSLGQDTSLTCYRHCFPAGNPGSSNIPMAPAADFLARLWALYGEPDRRENSFLYTLKDTKTNLIFTAYCQDLVPAYGGTAKGEKEKASLIPSLYLLEQLLQKTAPADCRLEIEIDFSKFGGSVSDEDEYRNQPQRYRATYIMGSQNGVPYLEIKLPPGLEEDEL